MKIPFLFLVAGVLFTTQAFANELCGRQYQICLKNFVSESKCAEGKRKCEEARKNKDQDGSKREDATDKKDKVPKTAVGSE